MTLYEVLTYNIPYHDVHLFDVKSTILQNKKPETDKSLPNCDTFLSLFYSCIATSPESRPSASEVLLQIKLLDV